MSPEDYPDIIRPYLRDVISNYKVPNSIITEDDLSREWKIHLTKQITFIFASHNVEICAVDSKSDNVGYETDDIIEELFESFKEKYHEELETKIKWSHLFLKVLIYCIIVFIK